MSGTTIVAGVTINCKCVLIREKRIDGKWDRKYTVDVADGHVFTVDNFTEDEK